MLIDFKLSQSPQLLDCDLCIVGAGSAGLTLAQSLATSGQQIVILEQRDRSELLSADTTPQTNWIDRWDEEDFKTRPWLNLSQWPLQAADLDPYLESTLQQCGLPSLETSRSAVAEVAQHAARLASPRLRLLALSKCRSRTTNHEATTQLVERSPNIRLFYNARAERLSMSEQGRRVNGVNFASATRRIGRVRATLVVIAAGGLGAPELLLNSNREQAAGIGNQTGLVGTHLMRELYAPTALAFVRRGHWPSRTGNGSRSPASLLAWRTRFALQEQRKTLAGLVHEIELPKQALTFDRGRRGLPRLPADYNLVWLGTHAEQWPKPSNRLALGEPQIEDGFRPATLHWDIDERDKRNLYEATAALGAELIRVSYGRLKLADWLSSPDQLAAITGGEKLLGGTRMGTDPRSSVVDAECAVHGVENLFVAGPSVLPVSSCHSHRTIAKALALRLADRLRQMI